jgi:hypothetical protein
MKTKLLILLMTLQSISVLSQNEVFKVIASKGSISLIQDNNVTSSVFVGRKILKNDKIIVGDNSYLGLVNSNGKTLELKNKGVYNVSKLNSELSTQNSTTSKKYSDYIIGEFNKPKQEDLTKNRYKNMVVTGSVERGQNQIKTFTPSTSTSLDTCVLIKWELVDGIENYIIIVTNLFGDVIFIKNVIGNSTYINLDNKQDNIYVWTIYSQNNLSVKSESNSIMLLSYFSAYELKNKELEIKKSFDGNKSALNNIILAYFYEDNKLILDAMKQYEEAILIEPSVDDYKIMYGQFLERNNIAKQK